MTDNRVVLVTGSAKRIGACIASTFHANGFDVVVHANNSIATAGELVDQLNSVRSGSAKFVAANLIDQSALSDFADQTLACFGRLDVLVNNASLFYPTPLTAATQNDWDQLFNTNVRAAFFLCQALANELQNNKGSIVNVVDTHADNPLPNHSIYNMAKAALKTMTKSLAKDLGPTVRVNGVSPGAILWPTRLENEDDPEVLQLREKVLNSIPLNHLGKPEDIANMALFLATDASYITGQLIRVDGGRGLS
ncbi:MAG: pteridine reductase [Pseudomonadales bacterium]|nr:pteridine reductase [Pseudomonadales bacterium]